MSDISVTPAAPKRGLKYVFVGPDGLRAGWCALLFVAITAALIVGLNVGLHAIHFHGPKTDPKVIDPIGTMFQEALVSGILLISTLLAALITRRKFSQLGFSLTNALPRFIQGLFVGVAALSALIGLLYVCGAIKLGPIALHGAEIWRSGGMWALAFILVGLAEELMFRGYLQQVIGRGLNFRWVCLIMGILFTAVHGMNPGETPLGLIGVFAAGAVLSLSVWRTGTLWWAIGFHAAWDWTQSFLFGVADSGLQSSGTFMTAQSIGPAWLSGGATGPEGSVLDLGITALIAVIIMVTLRKDHDLKIKW